MTKVAVTLPLVKDHYGILELQVKGAGTLAYQFNDTQLHHIAQLIAGKSREQATLLLLEQPG